MTKHILTIKLKGNNTYHGMSHSWVYEESVTLYFGLFEKISLPLPIDTDGRVEVI